MTMTIGWYLPQPSHLADRAVTGFSLSREYVSGTLPRDANFAAGHEAPTQPAHAL